MLDEAVRLMASTPTPVELIWTDESWLVPVTEMVRSSPSVSAATEYTEGCPAPYALILPVVRMSMPLVPASMSMPPVTALAWMRMASKTSSEAVREMDLSLLTVKSAPFAMISRPRSDLMSNAVLDSR